MTGLQRGAYRFQSFSLALQAMAFLCLIADWFAMAVFLLILAFSCLVKAMMYRERWEMDRRFAFMEQLREEENGLD